MNAPEIKTLADPSFQSIFNNAVVEPYDEEAVRQALINHGEKIMREHIQCDTTTEHNHTLTPESLGHQSSSVDSVSTIVGVSGATYAPMDTSPQAQTTPKETRLDQLTALLNETLKQMVIELNKQADAQTNLEEAVSTTLEQAEWFRERIEDSITDAVEEKDFDYEIGQNIERYMRNHFDPNDHVDFEALVKDRVEDELESIIDNLVEEAVEARLADLLEEKLANAKITINF